MAFDGIFNVRDPLYGALGDGIADDSPSFRLARDAAQAVGGKIVIPPGMYRFASPVPITSRLAIEGMGWQGVFSPIAGKSSYIKPDAGVTAFNITTDDAILMEKFGIAYAAAAGTVPAIILDRSAQWNSYSTLRDLHIRLAGTGIETRNVVTYLIDHCLFEGSKSIDIWSQDIVSPGNGDSVIDRCTMTGNPTLAHVYATSGGGLRVTNNKINGSGASRGVWIHATQNTEGLSPILINDNSIEGQHDGIMVDRVAGSAQLAGALGIVGNEIAHTWCGINMQANAKWINGVYIAANQIWGSAVSGQATNIYADGVLQGGLIASNLLMAAFGTVTGIAVGPHNDPITYAGLNHKGLNVL